MSGTHNGLRMVNGVGVEVLDGKVQTVLVEHRTAVEMIDAEQGEEVCGTVHYRANVSYSSALKWLCGYDTRSLREIAAEIEVSAQRLGMIATQIADRVGITTFAPGRRRKKAASSMTDGTAELSRLNQSGVVNAKEGRDE